MTLRPSVALKQQQQRPLSAIFIGSLGSTSSSTPPDLPRLPEPPVSPGGSSNASGSGLPSPPATNSTGSGSVGDDSTAHAGSARRRSLTQRPHTVPEDMYGGLQHIDRARSDSRNKHSRNHSVASDDEDDLHENEDDEDVTARFDSMRRRKSGRIASPARGEDHSSALERVKSLTERNRLVLNKLSSLQRLSSPVPSKPARSPYSPPDSGSPIPSTSRPLTSSSVSRPSSSLHQHLYNSQAHSGSETERENRRGHPYSHAHSSSDSMSNTPTSTYSEFNSLFSASAADRQLIKQRRLSAPSPPQPEVRSGKQRARDVSPPPTPGPSQTRTPRKRASVAVTQDEWDMHRRRDEVESRGEDVMTAALAAVASSRNADSIGVSGSRGKGNISRQPLPLEFRDRDRREGDDSTPSTPRRKREFTRSRRSPSPSGRTSVSNPSSTTTYLEQRSPRRHPPASGRTSTVREITRRHQTRWLSEDMSASQADADDEPEAPYRAVTSHSHYSSPGRRQSGRPGSLDSPLSPSKRPLDERLRSAGITKRRDTGGGGDDVFVNGHSGNTPTSSEQTRRTRSTGTNSSSFSGDPEWESPVQVAPNYRLGGTPAGSSRTSDPRTPANVLQRYSDRTNMYTTPASRPVTSMAALHHDSPASAPPRATSRAYRTHEREASSSTAILDGASALSASTHTERPYPSAYTPSSGRLSTVPGTMTGGRDAHVEHRRLMLEALGMFESQLSRLPPMGHTTTATIPEVFQSSQQLVHSLDRLNTMLRTSTTRALEAQIEAEVTDAEISASNMSDLWQEVGAEHREHLRVSDEIIRTTTQFLLGVGKVLRDATANSPTSSSASHLRSISLDEDATRRVQPPEPSVSSDKKSSDGRRSREMRRSWDPREPNSAFKERLANLARSNTTGSRPSSALHSLTRGSVTSSESRSTGDGPPEQAPTKTRSMPSALAPATSASRRLYTPRDKRVVSDASPRSAPLTTSLDSQETVLAYEPSPTPLTRQGFAVADRPRALPPLAIPPSLPTLPSESLLRNNGPASGSDSSGRRKVSTSSNITVRAETSSFPPVLKPANTTTAVTPANAFNIGSSDSGTSLSRTDSGSSTRTNGITFSRPPNVSLAALSGLQRNGAGQISRTPSANSSTDAPSPVSLKSPMSGSETERPRTIGARGRASLDGARTILAPQSATLQSTRKERRRTITDIFAQVNQQ